jgi:hypothetical protein
VRVSDAECHHKERRSTFTAPAVFVGGKPHQAADAEQLSRIRKREADSAFRKGRVKVEASERLSMQRFGHLRKRQLP